MKIGEYVSGMRLRTLPLGLAPVVLGASLAHARTIYGLHAGIGLASTVTGGTAATQQHTETWFWTVALLCAAVAIFIQIAANFANDYSDGIRGTDSHRAVSANHSASADRTATRHTAATHRTAGTHDPESLLTPNASTSQIRVGNPNSSTSPNTRLVASGIPPRQVLAAAAINAAIAAVAGLTITIITGHWWFLVVGICCFAAAWFYVGGRQPYGYHGFGEIAVFIFFGLVATLGTVYALTSSTSFIDWYFACVLGFIAVIVLSVNNLRDCETDESSHKHTWMTMLGQRNGTIAVQILQILVIVLVLLPWLNVLATGTVAVFGSILRCVLSAVCTVLTVALLIRSLLAVRRQRWDTALPTASWSSLALAFSVVVLAL